LVSTVISATSFYFLVTAVMSVVVMEAVMSAYILLQLLSKT
jgi:hypothetical protein